MLSFKKCKELFDAGLRRESVKAWDMFYSSNGVFLVFVKGVIDGTYTTTYVKDGGGTSLNHSANEISEKLTPVFTLEELVFALHARFGIDYINFEALTVTHAADVYLKCMETAVPKKPLEIKLGGIYRMRNGGAAMVYAVFSKKDSYPVRAIVLNDGRDISLSISGRYYAFDLKRSDIEDLVRLIGTVDQIEWEVGMPMWRRKSDGVWVRSVVNETYLELIKEDPYSYAPVYENGRFVRANVSEAELMRQAFMESMKKW